jgi:cystathionine beta-lyase
VYGGTVRLFRQVFANFRVEAQFFDTSDEEALAQALRTPVRFLFIETPANPTLDITDIQLASRLARAAGVLLVVITRY